MLGKFSYLVYMLIFTLIPISILWIRRFCFLKKNVKIIFITVLFGVLYNFLTNPIATNLRLWTVSPEKTLGIVVFGFPLEDVLFFALVALAISSATLSFVYSLKYGKLRKICN